ncbi:MAG: DUF6709 family protein [Burkholderiaceae bacterium]
MNGLEQKVRATSLARVVAALIVLATLVFSLAANAKYIRSFFNGPTAMSSAQLGAAKDLDSLPSAWVTLSADAVHATGLQQISVRKKHGVERSRSVSANYFVAQMGDRLLLVKAHDDTPTKVLTGELKWIAADAQAQLLQGIPAAEQASTRQRFYPLMLDTADFKDGGYIGFTIAGLIAAAMLIVGGIAFQRWSNPAKHPALQAAAKWGTPDVVAAKVQNELQAPGVLKLKGFTFTQNFLMRKTLFSFDLKRLDDLLWAYQKVTQKKLYYVIPAGKTYELKLNFADAELAIPGKEAQIGQAIDQLAAARPWIVYGYSDQLAALWKKKRNEFKMFVAQRKKEPQFAGGQTQAAE